MRNCSKCLENNWSFEKLPDRYHKAICQNCSNEVVWQTKELHEFSRCKKCSGSLKLHESRFKPSKLNKPYYFNAYYRCEKCNAMYLSEKFKIINN